MAARRAFGSSSFEDSRRSAARRPRTLTAFWVGAGLAAAGLAVLATDGAWARGPFGGFSPSSFATGVWLRREPLAAAADANGSAPQRHRRQRIALVNGAPTHASYAGGAPVCVRLCDGYFFPLPVAASDAAPQAACNSLCPGSPTEVYYRNGSDKIEDAISARGQRYAALPVALRYRRTADSTCSCHRDAVAYAPLRDATLKRGDAVMTPAGFAVFRGAGGGARGPADFAALAAGGLPAGERAALQAMEKVSLAKVHPRLTDWLVAETARPVAAMAQPVTRRQIERVVARAGDRDDRIRMLVWRAEALN